MQLPGTDYTIAGMVASQCGIPLFAPFEGNASASVSSFFPQNICLGDILKNSELTCALPAKTCFLNPTASITCTGRKS
jgi:phosphoglycerol transferase MdoB-like AlkP superfamily enzyme